MLEASDLEPRESCLIQQSIPDHNLEMEAAVIAEIRRSDTLLLRRNLTHKLAPLI